MIGTSVIKELKEKSLAHRSIDFIGNFEEVSAKLKQHKCVKCVK